MVNLNITTSQHLSIAEIATNDRELALKISKLLLKRNKRLSWKKIYPRPLYSRIVTLAMAKEDPEEYLPLYLITTYEDQIESLKESLKEFGRIKKNSVSKDGEVYYSADRMVQLE